MDRQGRGRAGPRSAAPGVPLLLLRAVPRPGAGLPQLRLGAAAMTARQLAALFKARAAMVEPEFRQTTRGLAREALRFCRLKLTELIYSQPVPARPKSGKPMWKRTGNLRRSERVEVRDAYSAAVVNDATYAEPRHEAGKPGRRKTRFPAHWRDELRKEFQPKLLPAYRETVLRILRRGNL